MEYSKARPPVEHLTATVELAADHPDDDRRRFSMLGYTGAPVSRLYGKAVFALEGIEHKTRVPILLNHDESQIAGYADMVTLTDEGLRLEGFLTGATEAGRTVAALGKEGFPWEASVGLAVSDWSEIKAGETMSVNGADLDGPVAVGTSSRLLEVSFVTAGADKHTEAVVMRAAQESTDMEDTKTAAEQLSEFLAEFGEDRRGWAAEQFAAGKSLDQAKEELAAEVQVETDSMVRAELAEAKEEANQLRAELETLRDLKAKSRHPGVGFDGERAELSAPSAPSTPGEAWEQSETLRAEFMNKKSAWLAYVAREGFNPEEVQ